MKIILDIKKEKFRSFLKLLKKFDFLTKQGIKEVEEKYQDFKLDRKQPRKQEEIINFIKQYFELSNWPVEKAWLFGSYAREEQTSLSDVDIMVRFRPDSKIDLWDFIGIIQDLEDIIGCEVDLVREGGAMPFAAANIEKDKILIYAGEAYGQRAAGTHS